MSIASTGGMAAGNTAVIASAANSRLWQDQTLGECLKKTGVNATEAMNMTIWDICHESAAGGGRTAVFLIVALVIIVTTAVALAAYFPLGETR